MSMVELARANGIAVVLGAFHRPPLFQLASGSEAGAVISGKLNRWLRDYAEKGLRYVDYYTALAGPVVRTAARIWATRAFIQPSRVATRSCGRLAEESLGRKR